MRSDGDLSVVVKTVAHDQPEINKRTTRSPALLFLKRGEIRLNSPPISNIPGTISSSSFFFFLPGKQYFKSRKKKKKKKTDGYHIKDTLYGVLLLDFRCCFVRYTFNAFICLPDATAIHSPGAVECPVFVVIPAICGDHARLVISPGAV